MLRRLCESGLRTLLNFKINNNMKKIVAILSILLISSAIFAGGNRSRIVTPIKVGSYMVFGGSATLDTLAVSDTLNYIIYLESDRRSTPYIQLDNTKIGAGTATVAVTFWQSLDGTNYEQCVKGKLQGVYTKTLTLSATGFNTVSFLRDSIYFSGRYLKCRLVTSSTASVKQKFTYKIKALIP